MGEHRNFRMIWLGLAVLCLIAAFSVVFLFVRLRNRPPSDKSIVESFYAHRSAYEKLRDMLLADDQLLRVASWGVETTNSVGFSHPPVEGFSVARYKEYLALLRDVGGLSAFRGKGASPESVSVAIWASGWAGDTRHIQICWVAHEPVNQVADLDDYYRTPKPRHPVFRHIEGNWYIWADW